jgi:ferric-dicitrate binding protein FerR (iron transport regulator)
MKKTAIISASMWVLAACFALNASAASVGNSVKPGLAPGTIQQEEALIKAVTGNAAVTPAGSQAGAKAKPGTRLSANDLLSTGRKSYMSVILNDGSELRLDQNTRLSFVNFDAEPRESAMKARLDAGQVWVNALKGNKVMLKTNSCLASGREAEFNVMVANNGAASVTLYSGSVSVQNEFGSIVMPQPARKGLCRVVNIKPGEMPGQPSQVPVRKESWWQKTPGENEKNRSAGNSPGNPAFPAPADRPIEEASPSSPR